MMSDRDQKDGDSFPLSLIQHIQLGPRSPDKNPTRWQRMGQILRRTVRSRFGLRSAELADRFLEAKVSAKEGEAKLKHAQAINTIAEAAVKFSQAQNLKPEKQVQAGPPPVTISSYEPETRKAELESAIAQVQREVTELQKKGAKVEIRIAEEDPGLPSLGPQRPPG